MRKQILLMLLVSMAVSFNKSYAALVSVPSAQTVAVNFFHGRYPAATVTSSSLYYTRIESDGTVDYYVFNMAPATGFVIVSADDNMTPIIAHSDESYFNSNLTKTGIVNWMSHAGIYIHSAILRHDVADAAITFLWTAYLQGPYASPARTTVGPLVTTTWNQENQVSTPPPYLYNLLCPYNTPDAERCVTGCIATTMAQIMKYWNYPTQGTGSFSYDDNTAYGYQYNYGTLSANFGTTTYRWANMPLTLTGSTSLTDDSAVDILMYHAGVSVAMNYGDENEGGSGSIMLQVDAGAGNPCAQYSYSHYFKYNPNTLYGMKAANYSSGQWMDSIEQEINAGRPLQYAGQDTGGQGGHSWVCDGYESSGLVHMNWGWAGADDGYFAVSNLSVNVYNFSDDEELLIGIEPINPFNVTVSAASSTVCAGSSTHMTATGPAGASYSWSPTTGLGCAACATTTVTPTATTTYTVSVDSSGSIVTASLVINVASAPAAPTSVTRPASLCQGSAGTFTVGAVTGATSYTWTVSGTGWTGTSTTNSISLTAGSAIATITVRAVDSCGSSAAYSFLDTPKTVPAAPASVTRPASLCQGAAGTFTAAAVTGATSYTWTVSGTGWTGSSTTGSISLTAGSAIATITVKANNSCGAGAVYSFLDTPKTVPAAPTSARLPSPAPCSGSGAYYITPAISGATTYTWTTTGTGWSGAATTAADSIRLTAGSVAGTITVKANNTCGSSAVYSFNAPVSTIPAAPTSATLPTTPPCPGTTAVYKTPAIAGATAYIWTVTGTGWSGGATTIADSITLTAGTVAGTVTVKSNNACGSSAIYSFNAAIGAVPAAPSAAVLPAPAPCPASTAVYKVPIVAGVTSYTWTVTGTGWSGGATTTPDSITLTAGSVAGSVTVHANDACGASAGYTFSAPISAVPAAPSSATLPAAPCPGSSAVYSVPSVAGATSYTWTVTGAGWTGSSTSNSITLTAGAAAASVSVRANNACGSSTPYTFSAPIGSSGPPTPTSGVMPAAPCPGSSVVYNVPAVSGATSYTWTVTGTGWSGSAMTTTDSVTLTAGSATGSVSVTANNGCGSSTPYVFSAPVSTAPPAAPASVTLPTPPCTGAGAVYTVAAVSGATSYTWTVTGTGWSGSGTTTPADITLTAGSVTGSVSVTANNACGSSTPFVFSAPVSSPAPLAPTSVNMPVAPCPAANAIYSVSPVSGATSYTWTVTGTGWSGSGTTAPDTVTLTAGTVAGSVSVTANNSCGSSPAYIFSLPVGAAPPAPTSAILPVPPCPGAAATYEVSSVSSATSYIWTVTGASWSGSDTTSVNFTLLTAGNVTGSVSVVASNSCGHSSPYVFNAPIGAPPSTPTAGILPTAPCPGANATYRVAAVTGATSYTWTVTGAGWSGSGTTASDTVVLTAGTVAGSISVEANNACGSSSPRVFNAPIGAAPAAPTSSTLPTAPCPGVTATYKVNAVAGATSYTWTVTGAGWSGSATTAVDSVSLTAGTLAGSVSVTANNACGSSTAYVFSAPVSSAAPAAPSSVVLPNAPCPGAHAIYKVPAVTGATSYTWTVTGTGWSGAATTTPDSISLTAGSVTGSVSVTANNSCGSSAVYTFSAPVSVGRPAAPTSANMPAIAPCPGAIAAYSVPVIPGITSYLWSVSGTGWSGTGTTDTAMLTAGSVTGSVSVTARNACGSSNPYVFNAPITPLPPGITSAILPTVSPCAGDSALYSVAAVSGATSYTWSVSGGWTGSSTTTSITLTAGSSAGTVSVTADNLCGAGPAYVFHPSPNAVPNAATGITAPTLICSGEQVSFSTGVLFNATGYNWTFQGMGWSGANSTTNAIILTAGTAPLTIVVSGVNACGAGPAYTLNNVAVTITPQSSFTVSSHSTGINDPVSVVFTGSAPSGSVYDWSYDSATATPGTGAGPQSVSWQTSGTKTLSLTVSNGGCSSTSYSDTVQVLKTTGIEDINISSIAISIMPNPNDGQFDILFGEAVTKPFSVSLTDIEGRLVYSNEFDAMTGNKASIDVKGLPAAVYLATITCNDSTVTRKVVVSK